MYKLRIHCSFDAEHYVQLPDGQLETAHSHSWLVIVQLTAERLDSRHMVVDFNVVKPLVDQVLGGLDGRRLNDLSDFQATAPTAELVARYIYDRLSAKLMDLPVKLTAVEVQEAPGFWAIYQSDTP